MNYLYIWGLYLKIFIIVGIVADTLSKEVFESANATIMYEISEDLDFRDLAKIGEEIKKYLDFKNYESIIKNEIVITDAKFLPD